MKIKEGQTLMLEDGTEVDAHTLIAELAIGYATTLIGDIFECERNGVESPLKSLWDVFGEERVRVLLGSALPIWLNYKRLTDKEEDEDE